MKNVRAEFPVSTRGYSMVKIPHLNDAFLEVSFIRKQAQ